MKTLITRSLSGVVFAVVMLGGICFHAYSFLILFTIICAGCLWEYYTIIQPLYQVRRISGNAYRVIGVMFGLTIFAVFVWIFCAWWRLEFVWLLLPIPFAFAGIELYSLSPNAIRNIALNIFGLVYIALPFGLLLLFDQTTGYTSCQLRWSPSTPLQFPAACAPILGLLLLIWANDTFAYLGGTLFGRNKLYPEISPGKTWEGFIVGALFCMAAGYGLYHWLGVYDLKIWIGLALIASIIGTIGDLFESMIKRNVGIKDSGKIMPGHGGFLDRFDAFVFCIPFAFVWLQIAT